MLLLGGAQHLPCMWLEGLCEFQLPSKGDPTSGSFGFCNFSSRPAFQVEGALLDGQSWAGLQGRVQGDVDTCCVKQVGFQVGVDPTWFGPSCMNEARTF